MDPDTPTSPYFTPTLDMPPLRQHSLRRHHAPRLAPAPAIMTNSLDRNGQAGARGRAARLYSPGIHERYLQPSSPSCGVTQSTSPSMTHRPTHPRSAEVSGSKPDRSSAVRNRLVTRVHDALNIAMQDCRSTNTVNAASTSARHAITSRGPLQNTPLNTPENTPLNTPLNTPINAAHHLDNNAAYHSLPWRDDDLQRSIRCRERRGHRVTSVDPALTSQKPTRPVSAYDLRWTSITSSDDEEEEDKVIGVTSSRSELGLSLTRHRRGDCDVTLLSLDESSDNDEEGDTEGAGDCWGDTTTSMEEEIESELSRGCEISEDSGNATAREFWGDSQLEYDAMREATRDAVGHSPRVDARELSRSRKDVTEWSRTSDDSRIATNTEIPATINSTG